MPKTIIISGASSGFGAMTARHLANGGHTVYAGMRGTAHHNLQAVTDAADYADDHEVDLRTIDINVSDQASVDAAVAGVLGDAGRVDVVVHNAGAHGARADRGVHGGADRRVYDTNVLSTQRLNRAVLRHLRPSGTGCSCGSAPPAREAAHRPTSRRTSRPRRRRTPSRSYAAVLARFWDRDHHHRPRLLHHRHEPLRQRRPRRGHRGGRRLRGALRGA